MAWIDNYRQAKFRNIPFFVPNSESTGGRRGIVHEFPKRNIPYIEDMGRKSRTFNIDAVIIGDDYFTDRNDLLDALEKEGSGKLIHPYLGTLDVLCVDYSLRETFTEGRIARFSISFVESDVLKYPSITIDTKTDTQRKKIIALNNAKTVLDNTYSINTEPFSIVQSAINTIDKAIDSIENLKQKVSSNASFMNDVNSIKSRVTRLAYDVNNLSSEFLNIITFGTNETDSYPATSSNSKDQFNELKNLFDFVSDDTVTSDNSVLYFTDFIQQNAVINSLGLLTIIDFNSLNEAVEFRDIVFNKVESILLSVNNDDIYTSIYNLKTIVAEHIENQVKQLPKLYDYPLNTSLPVVVISYDLYGNIDEEQNIIDRNKIEHPLFSPGGGTIIEVKNYE